MHILWTTNHINHFQDRHMHFWWQSLSFCEGCNSIDIYLLTIIYYYDKYHADSIVALNSNNIKSSYIIVNFKSFYLVSYLFCQQTSVHFWLWLFWVSWYGELLKLMKRMHKLYVFSSSRAMTYNVCITQQRQTLKC